MMEKINCPKHSESLCVLKTGTKPGPSKGVSFYMCTQCKFVKPSKQPPLTCSIHDDKIVELQSIFVRKDNKGVRRYYRCDGRDEGKSWCGYQQVNQEQVDLLTASSHGRIEEKEDRNNNANERKEKLFKEGEGARNVGEIKETDASLKKQENIGINSSKSKNLLTLQQQDKVDQEKKSVLSTPPLTFSDLSKINSVTPVSNEGNKTPFQNKSFNQYRDSPDLSKPNKPFQRERKEKGSSNSDSDDDDVQDTKTLMKSLSIKDSTAVNSKTVINSEQTKIQSTEINGKISKSPTTETKFENLPFNKCEKSNEKDFAQGIKTDLKQQTIVGSDGDSVSDKKMSFDARGHFRSLKEDRRNTVAELNKIQSSLRAIRLSSLPDKGERILARVAAYKEHIVSIDKQMVALLKEHGTGITEEASAHQGKSDQNWHHSAKGERVNSQTGNVVKTVIVRPHQAVPGISATTQNTMPDTNSDNMNKTDVKSGGTQFTQLPSHFSQYFAANPQAMTLYGGRMTAQRLRDVGTITTEAIDKIHKQLESCPTESTQVSDPDGLRVPLMPHQRQALAWLEWREQQHPAGGILADDMGLGKTLTMISHIMRKKQDLTGESSAKDGWLGKDKQARKTIRKSRASLIVAPASLIHQWAKEIEKRCSSNCLKFLVYHGPNRESNISRLCDNDIVITTYAIVSKEVGADGGNAEQAVKDDDDDEEEKEKDGEHVKEDCQAKKSSLPMLLRIGWERIILDEAHDIKNHKSARAQSVCRLRAAYRWALTGTPIQNDLKDMYSLLRFLRFSPFDELKVWKRHIESAKVSAKRLNTLVKALLLRRTKDQTTQSGKPLVELPNKSYENVEVELSEEEQKIYDKLFQKTQTTVKAYVHRHQDSDPATNSTQLLASGHLPSQHAGGSTAYTASAVVSGDSGGALSHLNKPKNTGSQILVFLLRLRQCCSHLSLLKAHLESESLETDGIELSLHEQMKGLMLDEGEGEAEEGAPTVSGLPKSDLLEMSALSTKLSHVMTKIKTLREEKPSDKSVIVSQWTAMLQIVAHHLKESKVTYSLIQGNVPSKKRAEIVEDFNKSGAGAKVLLVSLCAGGVGLNLIGGNHLFLLDSHWNPALEAQACDRIYRIGQQKDVKIYRFICKKTIEEKIWMLQQGKLSLAKSVLSGSANKNQKLSLDDLRMLFGV